MVLALLLLLQMALSAPAVLLPTCGKHTHIMVHGMRLKTEFNT
jgi:hypothetical protein